MQREASFYLWDLLCGLLLGAPPMVGSLVIAVVAAGDRLLSAMGADPSTQGRADLITFLVILLAALWAGVLAYQQQARTNELMRGNQSALDRLGALWEQNPPHRQEIERIAQALTGTMRPSGGLATGALQMLETIQHSQDGENIWPIPPAEPPR